MEKEGEVIEVTATEESEVVETQTTEVKEVQTPETENGEGKDNGGEKKPIEDKAKAEAEERERNKRFAKDRIEKKNRAHRLEVENAELRGELKAIKTYGLQKPSSVPAVPEAKDLAKEFEKSNPKPKPNDFAELDSVVEQTAALSEAMSDWKWRQNEFVKAEQGKAKEAASQKDAKQTEQDKVRAKQDAALDAQRSKGEEKYEDFEEVIREVDFHPAVLGAIARASNGEDIAYYLGMNPEEHQKLDDLATEDPLKAVLEIGRIRSELASGKIQVKRTTTAPAPPRTVQGNASPKVDESKISDTDWWKRRQAKKLQNSA